METDTSCDRRTRVCRVLKRPKVRQTTISNVSFQRVCLSMEGTKSYKVSDNEIMVKVKSGCTSFSDTPLRVTSLATWTAMMSHAELLRLKGEG